MDKRLGSWSAVTVFNLKEVEATVKMWQCIAFQVSFLSHMYIYADDYLPLYTCACGIVQLVLLCT